MTPEEQIAQVLSGWFAEHLTYETFRTTSDGDLAAGAAGVLVAAGIGPTAEVLQRFRAAAELTVQDVRAQRGDHIAGLVEDSFAAHFARADR